MTTAEEEVERVLSLVQSLDPVGVGARSLAECILLQLAQLLTEDAGSGDGTSHRRAAPRSGGARDITRRCKRLLIVEEEELSQALALVRGCHPRPGAALSAGAAEFVVPDVFVRRTDRGWSVEMNAATPAEGARQ